MEDNLSLWFKVKGLSGSVDLKDMQRPSACTVMLCGKKASIRIAVGQYVFHPAILINLI